METLLSGDEQPDRELVSEALAGSERAFVCLMTRYRSLIWRLVRRMTVDADDASDICQEIVIRVWRVLPRFRPELSFAPWLRTIVVRETIRWLQRNRTRRTISIEELGPGSNGLVDQTPSADSRLLAQENKDRVNAAIAALSPRQRAAVALRFFEGLPLSAVAEAMNCSQGSVKRHLFRAMEKLRSSLSKEE